MGLLVVLAISAVGTTSASAALPLFSPSTKQNFTASQKGTGFLEVNALEKIECSGGSSAGAIANLTQTKGNVVTFTGCTASLLGACTTSGANSGEIHTVTLKGELGETEKAAVLGLLPESGTTQSTFSCGSSATTVKGGTICAVTTGKSSIKGTLDCVQSGGKQKYTEFEGSSTKAAEKYHPETTRAGTTHESGESAEAEITYEKAVEVT